MARPQVGIERLPAARRNSGLEQRESMNCKSCRKRKIKCNRLRPTCEACKIFQCPCLYDAVPKKRGPKTDVLEALVKRIDGLEKKLSEERKNNAIASSSAVSDGSPRSGNPPSVGGASPRTEVGSGQEQPSPREEQAQTIKRNLQVDTIFSPIQQSPPFVADEDIMFEAYFVKVQDKPFHILDEATVRHQYQIGAIPQALRLAIYAVGSRFTNQNGDYASTVRLSEEYATQARAMVDVDEPSIEGLQALLLIHRALFAAGKGRRSFMVLSMAIGMAIAMNLHREASSKVNLTPSERELRRSLFWTCYLMDRFTSCGSKRPALISDNSMMLRLPSWISQPGAMPTEGEYFSVQTNLQYAVGTGRFCQHSSVVLIDIARILGETNRYLANGGVKGDSHFPWHALSNLSKIRQALDVWASGNQDLFTDVESLFAHPDCVVYVLSKMIYHTIHCLIYRHFLPIDLAELRGTGEHQSWQIEATNLCFLHANAVAELARVARQSPSMEWPAFTAYCIGTAGTVHVHGAYYKGQEGEVFSASADYLSQEMQILSDLRYQWACTQYQRDTLQRMYIAHSDLIRSLSSNPTRSSPVFHLEDFFDRYPGYRFDGAHVSFVDVQMAASTSSPSHGVQTNFNPAIAQQVLTPLTPLTPSISQTSHPSRRYTDSAISVSTTASCDEAGRSAPSQLGFQGADFAYASTLSPAYSFAPLPPATSNGAYDPALSATSRSTRIHTDHGLGGANPVTNISHDSESRGHKSPRTPPDQDQARNATTHGPDQHQKAVTPSALSTSGSRHEDEKDPFLTLLEQLAENEHRGGQSDLDFYLDDA